MKMMSNKILSAMLVSCLAFGIVSCSKSDSDHFDFGDQGSKDKDSYEYVDLALPSGTKWATCNIGASNPEEIGSYFAWAETTPGSVGSLMDYKWYSGQKTANGDPIFTSYDGNDFRQELDVEDDAAYINWGKNWRMPSDEQFLELINNCTWTWTEQDEIKGYTIEGKNGKSIFMPVTGYYGLGYFSDKNYGYYWSRKGQMGDEGVYLCFSKGLIKVQGDLRYFARCVRPVRIK